MNQDTSTTKKEGKTKEKKMILQEKDICDVRVAKAGTGRLWAERK